MEPYLSTDILNTYPKVDEPAVDRLLAEEITANKDKIIVLDDDPTGVQTVHDISVYTHWDEESIRQGFAEENKLFYILTNSRGMTASETTKVHQEIGKTIAKVAHESGKSYFVMSRSDSTLRGHYPLEPALLREAMEADGFTVDGEILCPFFKEGGRFTINNIHYVKQGNELVPAAETEFAKDKTFHYSHSAIPEYIEEKTHGEYKADSVTCISLEDLRSCNYEKITEQLNTVKGFNKIVVNAVDYCDIKVFAVALYRSIRTGKMFMFRTAAGLVKVLGGISDIPLLTGKDMVQKGTETGGIVVVGSHTAKTTAQLTELLKLPYVVPIAFDSDKVLEGDEAFQAEVNRCVAEEEKVLRTGKTAVCYTSRKLLTVEGDTPESALIRSVKISDGVQQLVGRLGITPAFIVAKGGITSSDIGTKALKVRRADVLGQIIPSVPVWKTGEESTFPGTPYIIFPGNTGDETSLRQAVEILHNV